VREGEREAAEDAEHAERDDERGDVEARRQRAVEEADAGAEQDGRDAGQGDVPVVVDDQIGGRRST